METSQIDRWINLSGIKPECYGFNILYEGSRYVAICKHPDECNGCPLGSDEELLLDEHVEVYKQKYNRDITGRRPFKTFPVLDDEEIISGVKTKFISNKVYRDFT